jgi:hypothetical protein
LPKKKGAEPKPESDAQVAEEIADFDVHPKDVYVKELPKKPTEHIDKYAIKDVKTLPEAIQLINGREFNRNGELINLPPKPTKEEIEAAERAKEEEEKAAQAEEIPEKEESEEEVHVEQLDLSNVKSKILEPRVKKARPLDPVYEKERLERRKERIKVEKKKYQFIIFRN